MKKVTKKAEPKKKAPRKKKLTAEEIKRAEVEEAGGHYIPDPPQAIA